MRCPPEGTLEQFLAGLLPASDTTGIDRHVSSCETCQTWLSEARADEALLPALGALESEPDGDAPLPERIADYRIIQKLGEGGMGVVYEAEQEKPRRRVALKVVRPGVVSRRILRRFEHEAQVLGLLQHPGIAQIHEAGTFQSELGPQPFFAMELVRGQPLMEHIRSHRPDLRARLALMIKVAEAVHHAHEKGVIHRDLKPGNILVDRHGQPKVLDFGVARLTEAEAETVTTTLRTRAGELIGTLAYMSPEQVRGDPAAVDTRSDVYALAAICYQVLTGRLPHDLRHKSLPEAVRTIGEEEPTALAAIDRTLRGDLDTIVHKGLEKDRNRRYPSAAELAQELGRFLRDEPIVARPPSALYQLQKFARRNKALVGGVVAVFLVLVAGIAVTLVLWNEAEDAAEVARAGQKLAEERFAQAEAARDFLQEVLIQAAPDQQTGKEPTIREALATALERVDLLQDRPYVEAAVRHTLGRVQAGLGNFADAETHLDRSLQLYERLHGRNHEKVAHVLADLAIAHTNQGRFDEAEKAAHRAIEMHRLLGGGHHIKLGAALSGLGVALYGKGDLEKAERYTREAIEAFRRLEGRDGVNVAVTKGTLAMILSRTGDPEETEKLYREALARQRAVLGDQNPIVATTMANLAGFLEARRSLEEAEALYREALAIHQRKYGAGHAKVGLAKRKLGAVLCRGQRHEEGLRLIREGLALEKRSLGPGHFRVAQGQLALATALANAGDLEAAEAAYREAVEAATVAMGPRHLFTQQGRLRLAATLARRGNHTEAEGLLEEIVATAPPDCPEATQARNALAKLRGTPEPTRK